MTRKKPLAFEVPAWKLSARLIARGDADFLKRQVARIKPSAPGGEILTRKGTMNVVRVDGVPVPAALILKQDFLSLGADAVTAEQCISFKTPSTGMLFLGSDRQFERLLRKCPSQAFVVPGIGRELKRALDYGSGRKTPPVPAFDPASDRPIPVRFLESHDELGKLRADDPALAVIEVDLPAHDPLLRRPEREERPTLVRIRAPVGDFTDDDETPETWFQSLRALLLAHNAELSPKLGFLLDFARPEDHAGLPLESMVMQAQSFGVPVCALIPMPDEPPDEARDADACETAAADTAFKRFRRVQRVRAEFDRAFSRLALAFVLREDEESA